MANSEISISPCGLLKSTIRVPGSKSLTNRALICAALSVGKSRLRGVLRAEDTEVMIHALQEIGVQTEADWSRHEITVRGLGGPPNNASESAVELNIAGSGTSMRFLTAALAAGQGKYRIAGNDRMHQRPIGDLIQALNSWGADVQSELENDCPPLLVNSPAIRGGTTTIAGSTSSQFLSGLLMVAPLVAAQSNQPAIVELEGELVSRPFVQLTLDVMHAFGISVQTNDTFDRFIVETDQKYHGTDYSIEPDATAASYFWAAAAVCGGSVEVQQLNRASIQGDKQLVQALQKMGCKTIESRTGWTVIGPARHGIDIDMGDYSDTVQTLAVVALFVNGPTTIRGIAHNRFKESDRIADLARELRKFGAQVEEFADGMTITPPGPGELGQGGEEIRIDTYNDHRMAMSLAIAGLKVPGVVILDPGCVSKTFPEFFDVLAEATSTTKLDQ